MGINIPTSDELIANKLNPNQLAEEVGAESLIHLSVEGLEAAVRKNIDRSKVKEFGHCTACLTGKYPVSIDF